MATVTFVPGVRGMDPLVPRPIDLPTVIDLGQPDHEAMDLGKIFAAPDNPADWPRWRAVLADWRDGLPARQQIQRARYEQPEGEWAHSCRVVAQVWLWDELLYDFAEARFTPERLLDDATRRFGGFDGIVLWHAYPVIGIDERNQWDHYRNVPGLVGLIATLHERGVAVFLDYNPWDTGTRRSDPDLLELPRLVRDLGADGVFLDTLKEGDPQLVEALEEARPGVGLESESTLPVARISEHRLSWAQWFADSDAPGVLRSHFVERRHMQHHVRRWHRSHACELQSAFVNGVGVMVWEVVFGAWVGWSTQDAATLLRMVCVQRAVGSLLLDGEWTPLAELHPDATAEGVFGSAFSEQGVTVYCLVNRRDDAYHGPLLADTGSPTIVDSGPVPGRGVGVVVTLAPGAAEPSWVPELNRALLAEAGEVDPSFPYRDTVRVTPESSAGWQPPTDARHISVGVHHLTVRYRMRETGLYGEAPFVDEWKPLPPRLHDLRTVERQLVVDREVAVAATEVTNAEFDLFVRRSGYTPQVPERFRIAEAARPGDPATFVDLTDARAYAREVGARLPTEDEWQLAAPTPTVGDPVAPRVWNWTESEHSDGRTRFVLLKGGSDYLAVGSEWYFDGGPQQPDFSAKLLLPGLGQARSSQIGFRLAWDRPRGESG